MFRFFFSGPDMLQLAFLFSSYIPQTNSETFTIGYLTGSQRRPGKLININTLWQLVSVWELSF